MEVDETLAPASFRYREIVITVVRGPYKGREFFFTTDVVTVGKAPQNDIPLPDETVSRRHLEILREPKGYLLKDLGSMNGTFLDGAEIREAFLRTGSLVTVGETRFRFRAIQRRMRAEPFEGSELDGLIGTAPGMRRAFALAHALAPLDVTVQIVGEPGTGRRSLARVMHRLSALRAAPFTVVDCSGETPARLEKQLFQERTGALVRLEGGTVVLYEPWELPPALHRRVAEAIRRRPSPLATGPMTRPGGGLRFIAVSSRELQAEVDRGRLDPELRDVLERVRIELPALRERREDLAALVTRFLGQVPGVTANLGQRIAGAVLALGHQLRWEENVASLQEVVEALAQVEKGGALTVLEGTELDPLSFDPGQSFGQNKARWVEVFERQYLVWLLEQHQGNVSRASRSADMDRKHLHRLLKRYGVR